MPNLWITVVSGFLILAGTLGSVLPFLPGLPVAWAGLFIYSWTVNFPTNLILALAIFGFLIILTVVVDLVAPALAAKGHKASKLAVFGAILGAVVGIMTLGPIGILLGPFLGAFVGELVSARNSEQAFRVAIASLFGLVISSVFKLFIGSAIFIYFLWQIV